MYNLPSCDASYRIRDLLDRTHRQTAPPTPDCLATVIQHVSVTDHFCARSEGVPRHGTTALVHQPITAHATARLEARGQKREPPKDEHGRQ